MPANPCIDWIRWSAYPDCYQETNWFGPSTNEQPFVVGHYRTPFNCQKPGCTCNLWVPVILLAPSVTGLLGQHALMHRSAPALVSYGSSAILIVTINWRKIWKIHCVFKCFSWLYSKGLIETRHSASLSHDGNTTFQFSLFELVLKITFKISSNEDTALSMWSVSTRIKRHNDIIKWLRRRYALYRVPVLVECVIITL